MMPVSIAMIAASCATPTTPAPMGVGVRTLMLVDTTRSTPANGSVPARPERDLFTHVWYPAAVDPAANEVANAEPASGPWPLVVFVHGSSGTPIVYTWIGRTLARAGYVVVAADMPSTSLRSPGGATDWGVELQPGDVSFLADRAFAGDILRSGVIDSHAGYAVVGHSTGGTVALLAGYAPMADARVAAIVPLSGDACFLAPTFFRLRAVPLLAVSGTNDFYVPPEINAQRTYDDALAPKTLVVLQGGTHLGFTDLSMDDDPTVVPDQPGDPLPSTLAAFGDASACNPIPPRSTMPRMALADQHRITSAWMIAFLDAVMRQHSAAFDALLAAPELATVSSMR
jgi:alpha-beta hydrolase superfamily lysophospholipase